MNTFSLNRNDYIAFTHRVSSDMENLEMSGNFDARGKVREFRCKGKSQGIFKKQVREMSEKSGKCQRSLLCEIHYQPT